MNANIIMAKSAVRSGINKLVKKNNNNNVEEINIVDLSQKELQTIATYIMQDCLLSGTISNRLAEHNPSSTLVSSSFAIDETHNTKLKNKLKEEIKKGYTASIMLNENGKCTFESLSSVSLLLVLFQLDTTLHQLNLHQVFFG